MEAGRKEDAEEGKRENGALHARRVAEWLHEEQ